MFFMQTYRLLSQNYYAIIYPHYLQDNSDNSYKASALNILTCIIHEITIIIRTRIGF